MDTKKTVIQKFIMCACQSESILLEKYCNEQEIYLSLFGRGLNVKRYTFRDKLRHIWQILTKGSPYTDEIVLTSDKAEELAKALTELSR